MGWEGEKVDETFWIMILDHILRYRSSFPTILNKPNGFVIIHLYLEMTGLVMSSAFVT